MLPEEDEQQSEEHASEVCEVRHIIAGGMCQPRHQFDDGINNNEYARAYGYGEEDDEHGHIGEEPSEGEQYAEDGSGSADGDEVGSVLRKDHVSRCGGEERVNAQSPYRFLHGSGTESADEVVDKKAAAAPVLLQHGCEHEYGEHVAEDMREVGVHEHIGERLPEAEARGGEVVQAEPVGEAEAIALQHNISEPEEDIDEEDVLGDGCEVSHVCKYYNSGQKYNKLRIRAQQKIGMYRKNAKKRIICYFLCR